MVRSPDPFHKRWHLVAESWWLEQRESLMRKAIALDAKLGELEESLRNWWNDGLATWQMPDQSITQHVIVEHALDPAELERLERAHRLATMKTKGRWQ